MGLMASYGDVILSDPTTRTNCSTEIHFKYFSEYTFSKWIHLQSM